MRCVRYYDHYSASWNPGFTFLQDEKLKGAISKNVRCAVVLDVSFLRCAAVLDVSFLALTSTHLCLVSVSDTIAFNVFFL